MSARENTKRKIFWMSLLPYFIALVIALVISFFINTEFPVVLVNGNSMNPTLKNGDVMFCSKDISTVHRGDIVIFKENGERLVKRVIGLPGDTVSIEDGQIYVNGERLNKYEFEDMEYAGCLSNGQSVTLCDNQYFCLGDNRNNSKDSRYFGPVDVSAIEFIFIKKIF